MKEAILKEKILIGTIIVFILFLFLNSEPFHFPMVLDSILVLGFLTLYVVFLFLVLKEQPRDEREEAHMRDASRVSFIAGTAVLSFAIIRQVLVHNIDRWLVYTLITVFASQLIARIYFYYRR